MKTHPLLNAFRWLPLFVSVFALVPAARATVTNVAWWRLGENDPGAANGVTNTVTTNLQGGVLTLRSNAVYTSNVATTAASAVGSTLGLQFATGRYGTNAIVSTLTSNFGLELWVKPDATNGTQCLAYNGDSGASGWGLYLVAGQFRGLVGGIGFVGGVTAATNVWTHLALVRDNGTNTFYVNGVVAGSTLANAPNTPSGRFAVGAQAQSLTTEFFAGALDEVRVFTFAPGAFSTNDLLLMNGQLFAVVTNFPGVYAYAPGTWGDYDGDGRLDLLLSYYQVFAPPTPAAPDRPIWKNTPNGFTNLDFVTVPSPTAVGISYGAWADYDNDGRLDFMEAEAISAWRTRLWRNTGSTFTNVTSTLIPSLSNAPSAVIAWGDFNNDGRPDFIRTGAGQTEIWQNTAAGFSNVTASLAPGLPQLFASHAAWADFDKDGWLDFLFTGGLGTNVSQIWHNTGTGFSNVTATVAPGLPGVRANHIAGVETRINAAWGDYDNDGWLDLLIEGNPNFFESGPYITQLWRNNGGTFTNVPVPGLPATSASASVAWGDYDNDGRLDILIMGATNGVGVAQVWRNTGSGFTNVPIPGLTPFGLSSGLAWGDYDNDGRLDFLFSRQNDAQLWRNQTPLANTPPAAPTGLTAVATTNGVVFSWNAASDAQTPFAGLSYNVRAGTTPGGNDLISGQVNPGNGFRSVPALGNAQMNLFLRLNLDQVPLGQKIYWSVQAIDTAWTGGAFATESVFTNGFALASRPSLPAGSRAAWGDYDDDGLLDLFLTGNGVSLWRNTGSTFTNVPIAGLPVLYESAAAWGDYDNDGRLDFLITGSPDGIEETAVSQLWRNTGSGFTNVTTTQLPGIPGFVAGAVAWGDFDNDGRLDLAIDGVYSDGMNSSAASQLWRNTGSNFANVTASLAPGLPGTYSGTLQWADYDNDGWLDLFLAGGDTARLYRNTGSSFANVTATTIPGLPGLSAVSAAWGDYDNDGWPDLFVTGYLNNNGSTPVSQLWRNTGGAFTNVPIPGLPALGGGSVQWGDYDSDGRLDFLLNGRLATILDSTNQLWRNNGSGFVQESFAGLAAIGYGQSAWADYDNDGKLDFLTTGDAGVQLWRNQTLATNTPPTAPVGLALTASSNAVMLSWNSATDAQTPSSGLSYNVCAGTTPGGTNLLSAHVNAVNGFRRVPALGNAQMRHSLPLLGVTNSQTVYWSVQAVDTSFAGGPFATETSVVSIPQLAITSGNATNAIVSWTPPTLGWRLQETPTLNPIEWSNSPSGALNPANVSATNAAKFYRLAQP